MTDFYPICQYRSFTDDEWKSIHHMVSRLSKYAPIAYTEDSIDIDPFENYSLHKVIVGKRRMRADLSYLGTKHMIFILSIMLLYPGLIDKGYTTISAISSLVSLFEYQYTICPKSVLYWKDRRDIRVYHIGDNIEDLLYGILQ